MAIAYVQSATADTNGSAPSTNAISTTSGNLLVAVIGFFSSDTFTSISDTAGNTWNLVGIEHQIGVITKFRMYYAKNITGNASNVVTFATNSNSGGVIVVSEYSGVTTLDQNTYGFDGGSPGSVLSSGATSTRSKANELMVCEGALVNSGLTWSPGTNVAWVLPAAATVSGNNSGIATVALEYFIASSTGTEEGELSANFGGSWECHIVTFFDSNIIYNRNAPGLWWDYRSLTP